MHKTEIAKMSTITSNTERCSVHADTGVSYIMEQTPKRLTEKRTLTPLDITDEHEHHPTQKSWEVLSFMLSMCFQRPVKNAKINDWTTPKKPRTAALRASFFTKALSSHASTTVVRVDLHTITF